MIGGPVVFLQQSVVLIQHPQTHVSSDDSQAKTLTICVGIHPSWSGAEVAVGQDSETVEFVRVSLLWGRRPTIEL